MDLMAADGQHFGLPFEVAPAASSPRGATTGAQVQCSNVLLEPGFEAGPGSAWSESSSNGWNIVQTDRPRTGAYSAWLGGDHRENADIWQNVEISADAVSASLTYWYEIDSEDYSGYDVGGLRIQGADVPNHQFDLCGANTTGAFVQPAAVDLLAFAGTTLEIRWFVSTDENLLSNLYVDDVVLEVCRPSTQPDVVFNDDFETGNLSQWTTSQGSDPRAPW
jgi:kumamolisin